MRSKRWETRSWKWLMHLADDISFFFSHIIRRLGDSKSHVCYVVISVSEC